MGNERTHSFQQKSFHTPQPTTQFGSRPFPAPVQMKPKDQQTPDELENEAFNQNKFEAFGLQLKEKSGTITPVEQEQLGLLQAKMDDFWAQRQERASRFGFDFSKVSVTPPEEPAAPQIQPMSRQGTPGVPMEGQRELFNSPQQSSVSPIQRQLTIGQPEDKYEHEADRVASQVVEQINSPKATQSTQGQSVQRQEEKKEELQAKPEITAVTRAAGGVVQCQFDDDPGLKEKQRQDIAADQNASLKGKLKTLFDLGFQLFNRDGRIVYTMKGTWDDAESAARNQMDMTLNSPKINKKPLEDGKVNLLYNEKVDGVPVTLRDWSSQPGAAGVIELKLAGYTLEFKFMGQTRYQVEQTQ